MSITNNLVLIPVQEEKLTPREFMDRKNDHNPIVSSRFVPPKLGDDGYGSFVVRYTWPVLRQQRGSK